MAIVHGLLGVLIFVLSVALIYVITIQESKIDGLQGQIGSASVSTFKGKAGKEELLNSITARLAAVLCICLLLYAILGR
ncbi:MAG TPA: preprotein translocase subunit SecG [Chthonomonas sp.]|jgi:protein translocase SecG subunit|uniref:preprotein translocase subunit SecG n=1 Tax=Chthonomonas sp. TaxID=2282153 RepID=UPI002B4B73E0|nr:preprotein translocase subunit SecG [Chthonomonas sp.]HLH79318.1 preprotein translocase subunit SecG [Chthonomonas sp.]